MRVTNYLYLSLLLLLLLCSNALSDSIEYRCSIDQILEVNEEGELINNSLFQIYKGETIVIDRSSGKIIGAPLTNINADYVEVLTDGTKGNNYKVVSRWDGPVNSTLTYINVNEINESRQKSFLAIALFNTIITGVCH